MKMRPARQNHQQQSHADDGCRPALEVSYRGHRQGILAASFQPGEGRRPLTQQQQPDSRQAKGRGSAIPPKVVSAGADGAVMLWDAKPTVRALRFIGHHGPALSCAYSPKATLIASCGHDGYARLWIPNMRRTSTTYPAMGSIQADESDGVCGWRVHTGAARALAFSQDGSDYLYTVGDDKSVKCWDLNYASTSGRGGAGFTGNKFVGSFSSGSGSSSNGHTNWVRCLAVPRAQSSSQSLHCIASGGDDHVVHVWDTRTRRAVSSMFDAKASVRALSFDPSGHCLAAGDADGAVNVYDLRRPQQLVQHYRQAHSGVIHSVDFSPRGSWLLSAGEDGTAKMWDTAEGYLYCSVEAHEGPVRTVRFSDDSKFFVTGGKDSVVMVWSSGLAGLSNRQQQQHTPASSRGFHSDPAAAAASQPQQLNLKALAPQMAPRAPAGRPPLSPSPTADRGGKATTPKGKQPTEEDAHTSEYVVPVPAPAASSRGPMVSSGDDYYDSTPPSKPTRERSFERSEERYTHISPPRPDTQMAPPSAGAMAGREGDHGDVENTESAPGWSSQKEAAAYHELQYKAAAAQRLDNLETAMVSLAEHMREDQERRDGDAAAMRQQLDSRNARQRAEIEALKSMVEKLVEQQSLLLARLGAGAASAAASNSGHTP